MAASKFALTVAAICKRFSGNHHYELDRGDWAITRGFALTLNLKLLSANVNNKSAIRKLSLRYRRSRQLGSMTARRDVTLR